MSNSFWRNASLVTLAFGALYAAIFFMSGLVVYPVDYIIELITGKEYVDGWTPGFMVWTLLLFAIPIVYLISLSALWLRSRKNV